MNRLLLIPLALLLTNCGSLRERVRIEWALIEYHRGISQWERDHKKELDELFENVKPDETP